MKREISLTLCVALGFSLTCGLAQAAEERVAEGSTALARDLFGKTQAPVEKVQDGVRAVFSPPSGDEKGASAEIVSVERNGNTLVLQDASSGRKYEVPYLSEQNAEQARKRLIQGDSIDLSNCMSPTDKIVGSEVQVANRSCGSGKIQYVYWKTMELDCGRFTRVDLIPSGALKADEYEIRDIVDRPLVGQYRGPCVKDW